MENKSRPQNFVETDQGYTQENLEGDVAASVKNNSQSSILDELNLGIEQSKAKIEQLTSEMSQVTLNPGLIPVPADFQANPFMVIGATLRGIGGDTSSLDGLIAQKRQVAAYQKQVAAQNIGIQNQFARQQHEQLQAMLEGERDKVERYEFKVAEIVDELTEAEDNEREVAFETRVNGLLHGGGDVDAIINDFPQEFEKGTYSRDLLLAMKRKGDLAIERAERLALPEPDRTGSPTMPGWAAQDAQDATKVLSRGYWVSKDPISQEATKVPLTKDEIISEYTTLKAAISAMPAEQAEIWGKRLSDFEKRYKEQIGFNVDFDKMIEDAVLGGGAG